MWKFGRIKESRKSLNLVQLLFVQIWRKRNDELLDFCLFVPANWHAWNAKIRLCLNRGHAPFIYIYMSNTKPRGGMNQNQGKWMTTHLYDLIPEPLHPPHGSTISPSTVARNRFFSTPLVCRWQVKYRGRTKHDSVYHPAVTMVAAWDKKPEIQRTVTHSMLRCPLQIATNSFDLNSSSRVSSSAILARANSLHLGATSSLVVAVSSHDSASEKDTMI